jgi:pimeloyl-ACP methyl ester carboxylesterase
MKKLFAILLSLLSSTTFAKNIPHKLHYTDVGQGMPIVLIHAFPTDQRMWQPQLDGLKKVYRVITVDLIGFGESIDTDGKAVTMESYADEINDVLNETHIDNAIIAGESMGGYVALAFLEKYPEKTNGLILSDTQAIADSDETKTKREATAKDILKNGTTQFVDTFMTKALTKDAPENTKNYLKNIMTSQRATGMASALRGMALRPDRTQILASTTLPILIITGEKDVVIPPQQSENMHQLAKQSKLVTIPNAGHLSSLESPEMWNQAVIDFIKN